MNIALRCLFNNFIPIRQTGYVVMITNTPVPVRG